ncbi:MAG: hypothetical protein JW861_09240 [Bacteroidales bacterium]|nr:hypothetical protein [Bacteroidales bacterium]
MKKKQITTKYKWEILFAWLLLVVFIPNVHSQSPQKPFPQHVTYTSGTIKPDNYDQSQLDNSVSAFYDQWKAVYLKDDCGADQYYVWFDEISSNNSICVSEGQGYGMMIAAYMAGYDPYAKVYFDGLYRYYKAHPSVNNDHLMAWNQITGCINDPDGGDNSATDGDLDIAFALLLADKQWGSAGSINYLSEASAMINAIKQDDVNPGLWIPILGDWVTSGSIEYDDSRPSDFMMDHFRAFQYATGDNDWNNIINKCYTTASAIQTNFSPVTGLLPDFVVDIASYPHPAAPFYLESEYDGDFYYNACRTPLRITTDHLTSGDMRGKNIIQKMNTWIKEKTGGNPENIHAGYLLNGGDIPGNNYESGAFVGPFTVAAMADVTNQSWLNEAYTFLLTLELQDYEYYDNTLKLLCMLVLSGNYWMPQGMPGSIHNNYPNTWDVRIQPNPFNSFFTVACKNRCCHSLVFSVCDLYGRLLLISRKENCSDSFEETFDMSNFSTGLYFLKIEVNGERTVIKIFKS